MNNYIYIAAKAAVSYTSPVLALKLIPETLKEQFN